MKLNRAQPVFEGYLLMHSHSMLLVLRPTGKASCELSQINKFAGKNGSKGGNHF